MTTKQTVPQPDAWFHVTHSGELYISRLCRGHELRAVITELMFGKADDDSAEAASLAEDLMRPECWCEINDRACVFTTACGEDADIEVHRIDDPKLDALVAQLERRNKDAAVLRKLHEEPLAPAINMELIQAEDAADVLLQSCAATPTNSLS